MNTTNEKPEALQLADQLVEHNEWLFEHGEHHAQCLPESAWKLRSQHAELVSCKETIKQLRKQVAIATAALAVRPGTDELDARQAEIERLRGERDALCMALASSCDEEREQLWEACPGGGCSRALDAERELDTLRARIASLEATIAQPGEQREGV